MLQSLRPTCGVRAFSPPPASFYKPYAMLRRIRERMARGRGSLPVAAMRHRGRAVRLGCSHAARARAETCVRPGVPSDARAKS